MVGARLASLPINWQRISLPWPHWGQVVRSKPVSACSISCQVLVSLGVSGFCLVRSSLARGSFRLMRVRAFSSLVLALHGAMRP